MQLMIVSVVILGLGLCRVHSQSSVLNLFPQTLDLQIDSQFTRLRYKEKSQYQQIDHITFNQNQYSIQMQKSYQKQLIVIYQNELKQPQLNIIPQIPSNHDLITTADITLFKVFQLTQSNHNLILQTQTEQCQPDCLFRNITVLNQTKQIKFEQTLSSINNISFFLNNSAYDIKLRVLDKQKDKYYSVIKQRFNENGEYCLMVYQGKEEVEIFVEEQFEGIKNRYESMIWLILIVVLSVLVIWVGGITRRKMELHQLKWKEQYVLLNQESEEVSKHYEYQGTLKVLQYLFSGRKTSNRLVSLDSFRGLTLMMMIFVNLGGSSYWIFNHSPYDGITIADTIFPSFLWIMGTTMGLNTKNITKKSKLIFKNLYRGLILFLIGMVLINNGYDLKKWRIPGVLQLLGVVYILLSVVVISFPAQDQTASSNTNKPIQVSAIEFISSSPMQSICSHLIITIFVVLSQLGNPSICSCPSFYTGVGGISDNGRYRECTGGFIQWFNNFILGQHQFDSPFPKQLYDVDKMDPEGIIQWLGAYYLCYLGYLQGRIIKIYTKNIQQPNNKQLLITSFSLSILYLAIGLSLSTVIPMNKQLWSISFIFTTGCISQTSFLIFYVVVDLLQWIDGPYKIGMNSITIYIGHEVLAKYFPFGFDNNHSHWQVGVSNLMGVASWTLVGFVMYSKSNFISV